MDDNVKWLIVGIVVDVLSLILVFLPFIVLELGIEPYHRGFYCNDNSIHYPYRDDTVSTLVITLVGLLLPIGIIIITEVVRHFYKKKVFHSPGPYPLTMRYSVPHPVVCMYIVIGIFLFGCAINQSITNIGKFTIGRLRPHFIDVCRPDPTKYNCTNGNNIYIYVDSFECKGTADEHLLTDARLSFPSGHSSMAAYVAVFTVLYLQARFTWNRSQLLKHLLQVALLYGAIFVCLSRVSDYKHHWSDVLSGATLGTFVAALTSLHIFSMFKLSKHFKTTDSSSNDVMLSSVRHSDTQYRPS